MKNRHSKDVRSMWMCPTKINQLKRQPDNYFSNKLYLDRMKISLRCPCGITKHMMQASVISEKWNCPRQNLKFKSLNWFHTFGDRGIQCLRHCCPKRCTNCKNTKTIDPQGLHILPTLDAVLYIYWRSEQGNMCQSSLYSVILSHIGSLLAFKGYHPWILCDPNAHRRSRA